MLIEDYINEIKFSSNWAGDLEISETSLIYNCNIILYKYETNNEYICNLSYFNSYGDLDNKNKPFIFITLVNNNHYQLINLGNELNVLNIENNNYNLYEYNSDNTKKNINDYPIYPNIHNRDTFYTDMINYFKSSYNNIANNLYSNKKIWPNYINNIQNKKIKDNHKRIYRIKESKYFFTKINYILIKILIIRLLI